MKIDISKIYILDQQPSSTAPNRFWYDLTNNQLKRYDSDSQSWKLTNTTPDNVILTVNSQQVTLTSYLNSFYQQLLDNETNISTLSSVVNGKADSINVVDLTTDQNINGAKQFLDDITVVSDLTGYRYYSKLQKSGMLQIGFSEVGKEDEGYGLKLDSSSSGATFDFVNPGQYQVSGSATTYRQSDIDSDYGALLMLARGNAKSDEVPLLKSGKGIKVYSKSEVDANISTLSGSLSNKANDSAVVHLSGNENITNMKTFVDDLTTTPNNKTSISYSGVSVTGSGYTTRLGCQGVSFDNRGEYSKLEGVLSDFISRSDTTVVNSQATYEALELKQDKTLSSAITVDGTSQTTVEGALTGINTALDNYVKTDSNASLSGLTIEAPEDNDFNDIALTFKQHTTYAPSTAPSFTIRQNVMGGVYFDIGDNGFIGGTAIVDKSSGKLVTDNWLANNYLEKDDKKEYEFYALQLNSGLKFKNNALIYPYAGEFANGEKYKTLQIHDGGLDDDLVGVTGNYTTRGNTPSVPGKLIVTDPTVVVSGEGQAILPSLKDGSAVTVYTKDKADTEFAKADASNISNAASWKAKLQFITATDITTKQDKTDDNLNTTAKTIVGAINELNTKLLADVPAPITNVFTSTSTALTSIITDSTKANIQGKILISPNINNLGAIYVGQSITDKSTAFPLYPNQIVSFSFTDITNFKVATDVIGDKFNYVIEFGILNTAVSPAEGLIISGTDGSKYRLNPSGDTGSETFTLTKIS